MMNTKADKEGGALVMVMVIALAVVVFSLGIMKLHEVDAVEAVRVEQADQAFWIAEAGMQRALHKLRTEKTFRTNPQELSENIGNGSYYTDVYRLTTFSNRWSITSTGTVQGVSRALQLTPLLAAEVGYALMSLGGDSKLDKDGMIDADVYSYGKITVNGRSSPTINGEVQALDTRNLDYTALTSDDKVDMLIDPPVTDFAGAAGSAPTYIDAEYPVGSGKTNTYIDLTGGKVVKISGDLTLGSSTSPYAEGTYGNGTLIVDGDLTFRNSLSNPFVINDGAEIYVNGTIDAGKDGNFGDDVLIYSTGNMSLQKAAGSDSTTFLIEGNLDVNKDLDFNGLIFAEGSITVDGNMNLNGSLVAVDGFWLKRGYNVTYDGSQIPDYILENMIVYVTYSAKPGTWIEIPVL